MSITLRIILIISAILVLLFVIRRIKKSKFEASDALFWLAFSAILVLIAIVPAVSYAVSDLLGFDSPSNFVFFAIIAILLYRMFSLTAKVSLLRRKVDTASRKKSRSTGANAIPKRTTQPNDGLSRRLR